VKIEQTIFPGNVPPKPWYMMQSTEDSAEIEIFDVVGGWFGIEIGQFKKDFDKIKNKKEIKILINSPGGNVFDGMAIYNILAAHKSKITTEIIGIAASVASVIALAGITRNICQGTYFMIHDPTGLCIGTAADMRKMAEDLEKIAGQVANIYVKNSNLGKEEILQKMKEETWFTAEEAVEAGFADSVIDYGEMAALAFDISRFHNVPKEVKELTAAAKNRPIEKKSNQTGEITADQAIGTGPLPDKISAFDELEKQNTELTENVKKLKDQITLRDEKIDLLLSEKGELAKELADLKAERFKVEKHQVIEKALSKGKIIPRNRAAWEAQFDQDPAGIRAILEDMKPVVDFKVYGTGAGGEEKDSDDTIDPRLAKQLDLTDEEIEEYNRKQRKS